MVQSRDGTEQPQPRKREAPCSIQCLPSDTGYERVTVAISASLMFPLVRSSSVDVPAFVKSPDYPTFLAGRVYQCKSCAGGPRSMSGMRLVREKETEVSFTMDFSPLISAKSLVPQE